MKRGSTYIQDFRSFVIFLNACCLHSNLAAPLRIPAFLTFIAIHYLRPLSATRWVLWTRYKQRSRTLYCVYGSIRLISGGSATFSKHSFTPHAELFGPSNMQNAAPLHRVYGSLRSTTGFDYPEK